MVWDGDKAVTRIFQNRDGSPSRRRICGPHGRGPRRKKQRKPGASTRTSDARDNPDDSFFPSMTTTLTPSRPSPARSKNGQPRRLTRLRAALIHPMVVRAPRSGAEGSVSDLPSGSVEAESSPVLDPGSMARSAKATSRPICTWVSTRPDGGGLEMRWVSPPAPEPAQRGGD
jgi:hypothetical protein